jgi:hypothetical protein
LQIIGSQKYAPQDVDAGETATLTVTSVTQGTNGAVTITGSGTNVTYQSNPGNSYTNDTFTYTVSDVSGGTAVGTVNVRISPLYAQQSAEIVYSSGTVTLTFWGFPGTTYTIQRATDPNGPWGPAESPGTATANTSQPIGKITYTETPPAAGSYYYRLSP